MIAQLQPTAKIKLLVTQRVPHESSVPLCKTKNKQ